MVKLYVDLTLTHISAYVHQNEATKVSHLFSLAVAIQEIIQTTQEANRKQNKQKPLTQRRLPILRSRIPLTLIHIIRHSQQLGMNQIIRKHLSLRRRPRTRTRLLHHQHTHPLSHPLFNPLTFQALLNGTK